MIVFEREEDSKVSHKKSLDEAVVLHNDGV